MQCMVSCGFKQASNECDLPSNAWLFVVDVSALDGPDRLYAAQGRFGGSQGPEALPISKETFHRGMIALDQVVSPLPVDVPDAVEVRIIVMIDLTDDPPIGMRLVSADRYRAVEPYTLNSLVEEGFSRFRIAPGSQPEVDHLAVSIDCTPQVAPPTPYANIGFVNVPIDARPPQMFLGSLGQFRPELLDPAEDCRSINIDATFCKKIDDILVGQRIA